MNKSVLIIVDGNREIGFGHISRCLNLAEEFSKNEYEVYFLHKEESSFTKSITESYPLFKVDDYCKDSTIIIEEIIAKNKISYVIIDLLEREYQKLEWLKQKFNDIKIITITLFLFDVNNRYEDISFFPDLKNKINEEQMGKFGEYKLYSGPEYFIFRKEFKSITKYIRNDANKVLITMGGSDPKNITLKVVNAISSLKGKNFKVILSEIAGSYNAVKNITDKHPNIELINKTSRISDLMIESDIVILNGGATRYEVCLARTPFLAISIHKKQFQITNELTKLGVGINLGVYSDVSEELISKRVLFLLENYKVRKDMVERMENLFDTNGTKRIFNKIIQ